MMINMKQYERWDTVRVNGIAYFKEQALETFYAYTSN